MKIFTSIKGRVSITYGFCPFQKLSFSANIEIQHTQIVWMCRIIVSLSYIKVPIPSHYMTKRYRKLKLSFFTAFLTPVSFWFIWHRFGSELFNTAISARISNLKHTHMYIINCKFHLGTCILNYNYMFGMHILQNMRYSPFQGDWGKGEVVVVVWVGGGGWASQLLLLF